MSFVSVREWVSVSLAVTVHLSEWVFFGFEWVGEQFVGWGWWLVVGGCMRWVMGSVLHGDRDGYIPVVFDQYVDACILKFL